jgi:lysozyme family protein
MGMTTDQLLDDILRREGGWTNHPADKGGPTKYGITLQALSESRQKHVTAADVEALTVEEARTIYRERYIEGPGLDAVEDDGLRAHLVDCAVNHGPGIPLRWLQKALGVAVDGYFGPATRGALKTAEPGRLRRVICAERVRFYGRLITRDPKQAAFAAGWANRVAEFIEAA